MKKEIPKVFINEFVEVFIEKGIVNVVYFLPDIFLTHDMAKGAVQERIRLSNGVNMPLYADIRNIKKACPEARKYLSGPEGIKNINACAMLVSSPVEKLLGHAFLFINKPPIPTKLFTNKERAIEWLGNFRFLN